MALVTTDRERLADRFLKLLVAHVRSALPPKKTDESARRGQFRAAALNCVWQLEATSIALKLVNAIYVLLKGSPFALGRRLGPTRLLKKGRPSPWAARRETLHPCRRKSSYSSSVPSSGFRVAVTGEPDASMTGVPS